MREIFITGTGAISPQKTLDPDSFFDEIQEYHANAVFCIEPEYKKYIPDNELRRMSRILRMSSVAARTALKDAGLESPDVINVGTGLGCLADTEKFLQNLIDNDERLLNPTPFINSTHNTPAGQLALQLDVDSQNFTFVHNELTFEHALLDSLLLLRDGSHNHVLVGGVDEVTEGTHTIIGHIGLLKTGQISNLKLLDTPGKGSIHGEGATYFVLSNDKTGASYARIKDVSFIFNSSQKEDIVKEIKGFLSKNKTGVQDIDLIISGYTGDEAYDAMFTELADGIFRDNTQAYYKHLCGEYFTSTSFALWLGAQILKKQIVPEVILINKLTNQPIGSILIHDISHYGNHSLILLESLTP
jgi:3-oxoacyl-(acyl-carrier-protein) synthase